MAHKYLNDIGIESTSCCIFNSEDTQNDRMPRFKAQREKFGFDDRETWGLDFTLIGWLYSHLKMYLEIGGEIVDLDFHKFDIPVLEEIPENEREYFDGIDVVKHYQREVVRENVTERECIETAIRYMEYYLKEGKIENKSEEDTRDYECASCALRIVAEILPALWW